MKRKKLKKLIDQAVAGERRSRKLSRRRDKVQPTAAPAQPQLRLVGGKGRISDTAVVRARQKKTNKLDDAKPRLSEAFRPYMPPPGVVPKGEKLIAMDAATTATLAWAAESSGAFWTEGLQFFGYAYLSELTQRPEYRVISQVIATEMTRKWITIQAAETKPTAEQIDEQEGEGEFGGQQAQPDQEDANAEAPPTELSGAADRAPFPKEPEAPVPPGEAEEAEAGEAETEEEALAEAGAVSDKAARIKELEDELDRLNVREIFYAQAEMDGWMGRSHLYIDTGDTDNPNELLTDIGDGRSEASKAKVSPQRPIQRLALVEPVWCYPQSYDSTDPLKPEWYNPAIWFCMGKQIHASRLLTFVGRPVPDILKPAYAFGGLSLSQIAKPYIDNWLQTRQSVNDIIRAFSVMVLSTDMSSVMQDAALGTTGEGSDLFRRLDMFNALRDNRGVFAIDKNTEEFSNVSAPLSSLDALQAQSQEHMAAVSRIPLVKLLGISPHGLNASSEGELKTFYDTIKSYQEAFFRKQLTKVIHFVMLSLWGEVDEDITFKFADLWALDELQEATLRKTNAETDDILVNGVSAIHPEEVRKRVAADPDSPYSSIDVTDVPEPPEPELPGFLQGKGGLPGMNGPENGDRADAHDAVPDGVRGVAERGIIPFGQDAGFDPSEPRDTTGEWTKGGHSASRTASASSSVRQPSQGVFEHGASPPLKAKEIKQIGAQLGSNPGGVYQGKEGQFYVKKSKSPAHTTNELAAARLYQLAGSPTLTYREVEGGQHVATQMAKLDKKRVSEFAPAEIKQAQKEFAVHAWLANWDAVGLEGDNLGTINGVPTSLDLGGALEFRAQGAPKGETFGNTVGEFDTLRDPHVNPQTAALFAGMTPEDLKASVERVTQIPDEAIRQAAGNEALAAKLIARKNDLAKRVSSGATAPDKLQALHQKGTLKAYATAVGERCAEVAKSMNIDPARVSVSTDTKFMSLNGNIGVVAASTDDQTGKIVMFAAHCSPKTFAGVLAHEIEHVKYKAYRNAYRAEFAAAKAEVPDLQEGQLLPEALAAKYPLYQEFTMLYDIPALRAEGGVSQYSNDWWAAYDAHQGGPSSAVYETLAEMARVKLETGTLPGGPRMQALYNSVRSFWHKAKPEGYAA